MTTFGLHVIQAPSGVWIYVGSVPADLCETRKATKADLVAGRADMAQNEDGDWFVMDSPRFLTRTDALIHAAERGYDI